MKNFVFRYALLFVLTVVVSIAKAQNCYIFKDEASGYNVEAKQADLEAKACELGSVFASNTFKVYSYGFYMQMESYAVYSYQQAFLDMMASTGQTSPYYLLIGRKNDNKGVFKNFFVEVKIPNNNAFSCVDSLKNLMIEQTVLQSINAAYQADGNGPASFAVAEIAGMETLYRMLGDLQSGNCCIPAEEEVENWLSAEQFEMLNVDCKVLGPQARSSNHQIRQFNSYVTDYASIALEISGGNIDLEVVLNDFLEEKGYVTSNPKFFIVKNQNICNSDYLSIKQEVENHLPFLSCIVYIQDYASEYQPDRIWVRVDGAIVEDMPNTVAGNEDYIPPPLGATSFQDLINTIREAENILSAHGYTKIKDRIKIFRGLYYGTTWSMDQAQSYGSGLRNAGFKAYLCDAEDPINPEQIFGSTLYQKLKNSPEVKDGSLGVDWGHIIIALESRLSFCSREVEPPGHESTGLENLTWIGDIGGGAGMLAIKRVSNPNKRAIDMFTASSHDFGGWLNLEGDVAAYVIGRNANSYEESPSVEINDDDYIADIVSSYLLPQPAPANSEWSNRGKTFLRMLGGEFNNTGSLTNQTELVEDISVKVEEFAEIYVAQKAAGSSSVSLVETSKHLKGASKEITEIFIHALKNSITSPNQPIKASGINPNPTPPGEPYKKYKAFEKTKEIVKEIEDWLKN